MTPALTSDPHGLRAALARGQDVIVWDGECAFCRRAVAWMKRHDKADRFHRVPYQEAPSPPMTPALRAACENAVHVLTAGGQTLRAGRACMYVLRALGFRFLGTLGALPPFVWAVELGYKIVAKNRDFFANFFFRTE